MQVILSVEGSALTDVSFDQLLSDSCLWTWIDYIIMWVNNSGPIAMHEPYKSMQKHLWCKEGAAK